MTEQRHSSAPPQCEIVIRQFQSGDEAAFRRLNEEWISRYFKIEPKDETAFADPRGSILDPGGKILFATADNDCVGCCALIRIADREFELAKMAVTPSHQGLGIGRLLLQAAVQVAAAAGARRLYLETNHALASAIRLYESIGFKHLDPGRVTSSPYARADVYMELLLA